MSHLVKLSGTDDQINLSKGNSGLTAIEIRAFISRLESGTGDVDGDSDFDANDTFLIHLVKLSGTDEQITLQKGSSPLTASEIRANVAKLGLAGGGTSGVNSTAVAVLASRVASTIAESEPEVQSATTLSHRMETYNSNWTALSRLSGRPDFDGEMDDVDAQASAEFSRQTVDEVFSSGLPQDDFRAWLDLL